jgi:hypothetical protein
MVGKESKNLPKADLIKDKRVGVKSDMRGQKSA